MTTFVVSMDIGVVNSDFNDPEVVDRQEVIDSLDTVGWLERVDILKVLGRLERIDNWEAFCWLENFDGMEEVGSLEIVD